MIWPPDYTAELVRRSKLLELLETDPDLVRAAYKTNPTAFIGDWCYGIDPRNIGSEFPAKVPFILFPRQVEFIGFLEWMISENRGGLVEKSRDIGATWCSCGFAVWLWLYHDDISIGFGSRKEILVDRIGDMDSIFEKLRSILRDLPAQMLPDGFDMRKHSGSMKIVNPENGASITGEAGDNIGRGGRKKIYFKDEAAHYERADAIEAALMANTDIQVDISSVNGPGNVFHRRRQSGELWAPCNAPSNRTQVFVIDWRDHPGRDQNWYNAKRQKAEEEGLLAKFSQEYDRDYTASSLGICIPAAWVEAAIGFAEDFEIDISGKRLSSLDVADDSLEGDKNAMCNFYGIECREVYEWGQVDTTVTANRVMEIARTFGSSELQYDSIGVGAGVKGQMNQLARSGSTPQGFRSVSWVASGKVMNPHRRMSEDAHAVKNRDFFQNLKAQAWWAVRQRFYETFKCRSGHAYDAELAISISRDIPVNLRQQLSVELSQPIRKESASGKMMIDKSPNRAKSPNIADAFIMGAFPVGAETAKTGGLML